MTVVERLPLSTFADVHRVLAHTPRGTVTVGQFQADVMRLSRRLPREARVLNVCQDRYHFTVGLVAALVAGRVSLLPASYTPEVVRQLRGFADDIVCLHDGSGAAIELEQVRYPETPARFEQEAAIPWIEDAREVAYLFTSGSTGAPVAHRKSWGALVRDAQAETQRLGLEREPHSIVGTVPAQHMYGFESTVLLSLFGGCAAWSGRPFYPADIAATLARVPRPRLLVTTPFHLQSLLRSGVEVPRIDMLLSATAPLPTTLAREAETRLGAPLFEIYGSTETGQIASRRTIETALWTLFPGVELLQDGGHTVARGGHVEQPTELADVIELCGSGEFVLHGRHADVVNIAGKRTSLGYLNHQLKSIPLVEDGSFYCPAAASGGAIERLCAFVVAPQLPPARLLAELRQRIEAIFLPRPLLFLESMPRNEAGKLPRAAFEAILENYRRGSSMTQNNDAP